MSAVDVVERAWEENGRSIYQVKAKGRNGLIYQQTIIEDRWGPSRAKVRENVRVAAETGGQNG